MIRLTEKDRRLDKLPVYCHEAGVTEANHPRRESLSRQEAPTIFVSFRPVLQDILRSRLLHLLRMSVTKIDDIATREGNGNSGMVFDPPRVTLCVRSI